MIERLALRPNFWPLLALDHGLTNHADAIELKRVRKILVECEKHVSCVVMTYGLMRQCDHVAPELHRILQCFGAPSGHPKVQIADIEQAKRVGASGIAVQIDFGLTGDLLAKQIESIARIVDHSHAAALPALFMVSSTSFGDQAQFQHALRASMELGADLIKIRPLCGDQKQELTEPDMIDFISSLPPVVMAGGAENDSVVKELRLAKQAGFSGYCIGRNIYRSAQPREAVESLSSVW